MTIMSERERLREAYRAARSDWLRSAHLGLPHAIVESRWRTLRGAALRIGVTPGVDIDDEEAMAEDEITREGIALVRTDTL